MEMRSYGILKSPVIKGTIVLTLAGLITRVIGFYYKIFLSRIFHEEGLGIIGLTLPFLALIHSITTGGIQNAISKYVASVKQTNNQKSYCYLFSGLALSLFFSFLMTYLVIHFSEYICISILHETRCKDLLRLLAISFPLSSIHSCISSFFYAYSETKAPSIALLMEQVVRVLTVYLFYRYYISGNNSNSLPLSVAALGILAGECTSALLSCIFLANSPKILKLDINNNLSSGFLFSLKQTKELFNMSFPLSLTRIAISLLSTVETTSLPIQLSKSGLTTQEALSLYGTFSGIAFPLIMFPTAITGAAASLVLPTISEAQAKGDSHKIKKIFYLSLFTCLSLGFFSTFLFYTFSDTIGMYIFSSPMAGVQIRALSFVCPFLYLSGLLTSILHGLGKTIITFIFSILSVFLRLLFVLLIIPMSGIAGYFYGILISQISICLLNFLALTRYILYNANNV